jgi:hypothetical protein
MVSGLLPVVGAENTSCWTYKKKKKNETAQNFKKLPYEKEKNGEEAILN